MAKGYVIYNEKAGDGALAGDVEMLSVIAQSELVYREISEITDYARFFEQLSADDAVILCGGDGTLNRFVNDTAGLGIENRIFYYPIGSGNDFAREFGRERGANPFEITEYLKSLPTVTVNGREYRFLNGVGFGIDGYCCEVGDILRSEGRKINYAAIAIKGIFGKYKQTCARVTVDGRAYEFENVWLAPTMNGRYYGGGMMPAPKQNRTSSLLSVMVYRGKSRLKTLCAFPGLFKGTHIKHKSVVNVLCGEKICVEFDSPKTLQIDGETVRDVLSYTAEKKKSKQ